MSHEPHHLHSVSQSLAVSRHYYLYTIEIDLMKSEPFIYVARSPVNYRARRASAVVEYGRLRAGSIYPGTPDMCNCSTGIISPGSYWLAKVNNATSQGPGLQA
jgi:hypothetical protein